MNTGMTRGSVALLTSVTNQDDKARTLRDGDTANILLQVPDALDSYTAIYSKLAKYY